jgi:carbon storage regulator CsrA
MALVLNRTPQQQIYLSHPDGRITVTVLDVSGAKVRLAIDAPSSVSIERDDMKSRHLSGSFPCTKCGQPSWTMDGLCFSCQQRELKD